jgi:uncharacterized protein YqjF (DUF2071 family)
MTIKQILNKTEHRPWKIPIENWKFYQEWNDAIFLHWEVDYDELRKFVPAALEIDLFEGKPWVSLVAFSMEKVRPKNLPYFPPVSNFEEVNIRTYIKSANKNGVYFLSIEGDSKLSCEVAKAISGLPYRHSVISRTEYQYQSFNKEFEDSFEIEFKLGNEITQKTELDKWLTERYLLCQDINDTINEFEVHHVEWPIKEIEIVSLEVNYPRFKNLLKNNPDKIHYSEGVQVVSWGKQKRKNGL